MEAHNNLYVAMMKRTEAQCKQCGKPAVAWIGVDDKAEVVAPVCALHVELAVDHYMEAHGLRRMERV